MDEEMNEDESDQEEQISTFGVQWGKADFEGTKLNCDKRKRES